MQTTTRWEEKGMEKGQLPKPLSDRISVMSVKPLEALAIALLNFAPIDDLTTGLDNQE